MQRTLLPARKLKNKRANQKTRQGLAKDTLEDEAGHSREEVVERREQQKVGKEARAPEAGPEGQGEAAGSLDQGCQCLGCSRRKGFRCEQCAHCQNKKLKRACTARKCLVAKTKSTKRKSLLALPQGLKKRLSPSNKKARKSKTPPSSAANSPTLPKRKKRKSPPTSTTNSPTRPSRLTRSNRNAGMM